MIRSGEYHRERPLRPYYETPSSSYSSYKGCCCCVFLLLTSLALLALAALLVIALEVKPKKPELNLQQVGFQYMAITPNPNDPTTATLSLTVPLLFTMVNPNRVGIRCGESRFTVMYREILLGRASVSPFCQQPHSVRELVATVAVDGVNLPPVDAADLSRDAWLNDRVELRVLGNVAAKIRLLNLYSPRLQVPLFLSQWIIFSPFSSCFAFGFLVSTSECNNFCNGYVAQSLRRCLD